MFRAKWNALGDWRWKKKEVGSVQVGDFLLIRKQTRWAGVAETAASKFTSFVISSISIEKSEAHFGAVLLLWPILTDQSTLCFETEEFLLCLFCGL